MGLVALRHHTRTERHPHHSADPGASGQGSRTDRTQTLSTSPSRPRLRSLRPPLGRASSRAGVHRTSPRPPTLVRAVIEPRGRQGGPSRDLAHPSPGDTARDAQLAVRLDVVHPVDPVPRAGQDRNPRLAAARAGQVSDGAQLRRPLRRSTRVGGLSEQLALILAAPPRQSPAHWTPPDVSRSSASGAYRLEQLADLGDLVTQGARVCVGVGRAIGDSCLSVKGPNPRRLRLTTARCYAL